MAEQTILMPAVEEAVITPNPATINQQITIRVKVIDKTVIIPDQSFFSGEIYSGV